MSLKEFQKLDRDKRALEHTIYDSDLKSSRTKVQALDDERAELAEELKVKYAKSTDTTQRGKAVVPARPMMRRRLRKSSLRMCARQRSARRGSRWISPTGARSVRR